MFKLYKAEKHVGKLHSPYKKPVSDFSHADMSACQIHGIPQVNNSDLKTHNFAVNNQLIY